MATRENAPGTQPATGATEADTAAWLETASARKYRVQNGAAWSGVEKELFPLPPVPGFANIPPAQRPLVFQSVAQFVTYRIGQNADGISAADAVAKAINEGAMPSAKSNDAYESMFASTVASAVEKKLGALPKTASAEDKAARRKLIEATIAKQADQFDRVTTRGVELGSQVRPAKERKRKAASTVEAADISGDDLAI